MIEMFPTHMYGVTVSSNVWWDIILIVVLKQAAKHGNVTMVVIVHRLNVQL